MSHFTTLIVHKKGADIDKILAPFCETDDNFFEFVDFTDETKKNYNTDTIKKVKMPDGKCYKLDDGMFIKKFQKKNTIKM